MPTFTCAIHVYTCNQGVLAGDPAAMEKNILPHYSDLCAMLGDQLLYTVPAVHPASVYHYAMHTPMHMYAF